MITLTNCLSLFIYKKLYINKNITYPNKFPTTCANFRNQTRKLDQQISCPQRPVNKLNNTYPGTYIY